MGPLRQPFRLPPPRAGEDLEVGGTPTILVQPIKQVKRARKLRQAMSLPEVLLWQELRRRPGGFIFRRQFPSQPYTLDFACLAVRLGIEVDGFAHDCGDQPEKDEVRDRILTERGFRMLRIPAVEVQKNMEWCVMGIVAACEEQANLIPPRHGEVAVRSADGGVPPISRRGTGGEVGPLRPFGAPPRAGKDVA